MINFNIEHVSVTPIKHGQPSSHLGDVVCTCGPIEATETFHQATRFVNYKRMWFGDAACDDDHHLAGAINWMLDPDAGFAKG